MANLFVRYDSDGETSWGELIGAAPVTAQDTVNVRPLSHDLKSLRELIPLLSTGWKCGKAVQIGASQLLSPVTTESRLVCQGLNYVEHAAEAQQANRRHPSFAHPRLSFLIMRWRLGWCFAPR
jgi:2-keto-4-pentenoate hydratase/2-oxohepta-3-ene-1,7-dioic acid hydratase in catechol pathway